MLTPFSELSFKVKQKKLPHFRRVASFKINQNYKSPPPIKVLRGARGDFFLRNPLALKKSLRTREILSHKNDQSTKLKISSGVLFGELHFAGIFCGAVDLIGLFERRNDLHKRVFGGDVAFQREGEDVELFLDLLS